MTGYFSKIIALRHFLTHMAVYDLRQKYRNSILGVVWALLLPLGMAFLLSLVLSSVFDMEVTDYLPYVFSGLVVWEYVSSTATGGCHVFRFSQYYIRQNNLPSMVYTLRYSLAGLINFCFGLIALIGWVVLTEPENFGLAWLTLPFSIALLFLAMWPLATVNAYISTWLSDFSQLMTLVMQALFFVSPIFLRPEVFLQSKYNLDFLVHSNPLYHGLELFRAPLLEGQFPTLENWLFTIITIGFLWLLAMLFVSRSEKNLIFHF